MQPCLLACFQETPATVRVKRKQSPSKRAAATASTQSDDDSNEDDEGQTPPKKAKAGKAKRQQPQKKTSQQEQAHSPKPLQDRTNKAQNTACTPTATPKKVSTCFGFLHCSTFFSLSTSSAPDSATLPWPTVFWLLHLCVASSPCCFWFNAGQAAGVRG